MRLSADALAVMRLFANHGGEREINERRVQLATRGLRRNVLDIRYAIFPVNLVFNMRLCAFDSYFS